MNDDFFTKGLERRKAVLGSEYVEKNLAAADDLTRPFQEAMTAWCWGFGWGDDALDAKTRSLIILEMITKECSGLFAGEGGVMRIIPKIKNAYTLCKRKVTAFV